MLPYAAAAAVAVLIFVHSNGPLGNGDGGNICSLTDLHGLDDTRRSVYNMECIGRMGGCEWVWLG